MLADHGDGFPLGGSFRCDIHFNNILESVQIIAILLIDLGSQGSGLLQCLAVDADAVDHAFGGVVHTGDDVVFARVIHFLKDVDHAVDIDRDPVAARFDVLDDPVDDIAVNKKLADLLHILVDNVGTGACDPEIRLKETADEGGKSAYLTAGAKPEIISRSLIFFDLLDRFGRELDLRFVEIECSVEIACKYFFHNPFPFRNEVKISAATGEKQDMITGLRSTLNVARSRFPAECASASIYLIIP